MKSIKPGRGPSLQGLIIGIAFILFGIFWMIMMFNITQDSPFLAARIFPFFGLVTTAIGVFQAVYHYKNATGKNRMSVLDIVDSSEEPDPLNVRFDSEQRESKYCPYCGERVQRDFQFCPKCGKALSPST
ncbi:zinc ribbon domain-containing protein [Anoxybacteroides tepidamans]|uniref:zinc ribbon domain-containing protein n=1 Tax=Anoxybacteroides tepidamans TaxID=265948 RepID=UPI0004857D0F|nr:zinc ribbon domain-containing protein [Anoxybacillus tepidamans]